MAFGLEFRRDNYQSDARASPIPSATAGRANQFGGRADAGAQVFPGFRPTNAADDSRNSVAAYLDLEGDLHEKVRVGLAGRFENYDDFGSTGDGKVTVRVAAHQRFVLRGAVSTGFRAPSLSQSNFSSVSTNFITVGGVVTAVEVGNFAVNSPIARALGAQDLQPEQSVHYSGGVVWNPVAPLELTADLYRIDIDDRVVFSGNFTGPRIEALVRPFGANGGRLLHQRHRHQDPGRRLPRRLPRATWQSAGSLILSAAYNRTDTDIVGTVATPAPARRPGERALRPRADPARRPADSPRTTCA